ncbi:GNAT family N-acetyltransferase [Nodosilinea sp. FACHB-131]|nr:GNAT family N-acetyltransferase [Nodosilinea sp. FACHB-131]
MAETARIEFDRTFDLQGERIYIKHALIEADEYISFLARTNLGQQYPKERFNERIRVLVKSVQVSLIARNIDDEVVGVCFGLTDFAYWLFLTDLGIDRRYERRGIGKLLVESAHELAGGEKEIVLFANVNDEAIPFYNKLGMKQCSDIFAKWNIEWTSFEVGKDTLP